MGHIKWNTEWMFGCRDYKEDDLTKEPEEWEPVDLPHDWLIYNTQDLYRDSIGWYKKTFQYKNDGLRWMIRFEGIYMDSTIYVNGIEIGSWKYGYSTFELDLTKYLHDGNNELQVRVVHISPNSRWYSGAGIYRNVWLVKKEQTHIVSDGVYITPVCLGDGWQVDIDTEIYLSTTPIYMIGQTILDPDGNVCASSFESISYETLEKENVYSIHQTLKINQPMLWDIGKGNLYSVKTQLLNKERIVDFAEGKTGFRTIHMDAKEGLFINGKHVKIKGSCEHHGFGCLGAVANKAAIKRKLEILRSMGVNAIRTAHNMPSVEFMELTDEMGFLVDSEAFDMWGKSKTAYDYGRFYKEWVSKDIKSWIRRDRNHPSIIMWSLGNEIYDLHVGSQGMEELEMMIREVRKYDYKKHAKITFASNYLRWENAQKCANLVDLVGYNYSEYLYEQHHKEHPEWVIYGSETASMLASRGVYHFPLEQDILCEDNQQCSALGNCFAGWGAHDYLDNIIADRDTKFSLGQFIWSGFDYYGEPTPYHTKNSYFGQIDTAGFPKDSYYIYQAEWTDYKKAPMIHIFPYWDFNVGQKVDVCVCSNAPKVELFLNGRSLGIAFLDHKYGKDLVPHWKIEYEEGEIRAIAYDEDDNIIATQTRHSFGDVHELRMKANKIELSGSIDDLVFIEINAYDKEGYPVENANNRVHIEVFGAGRLVGIDNGDSTDFDQVKGKSKRLFQGKLLAVIAPRGGCSGQIHVIATSKEIQGAELTLSVNQICQSITVQENQEMISVAGGIGGETILEGTQEIPIRKVELLCNEDLVLTPKHKELRVSRKIVPSNATYKDTIWKIVNDTGIKVAIATLEEIDENEVIVRAYGDGECQLRCVAMNGGNVACVRSVLPIKIEGIGMCYMNPYETISAGLCKDRPRGLSEGEDHGVRFLGEKETYISYEEFDFGICGTQGITMELFKYMPEPISFSIYMEEEKESSKQTEKTLLVTGIFDQTANWMEFKKQTYYFTHKIKGIKRISFVSRDNFQFKSFVFIPIYHGLEKISAVEYDEIFGDSYVIKDRNVESIGNNVMLYYRNINFGNKIVTKLIICGRSELENNSIHVKFEQGEKTHTELIEFAGSSEFTVREYQIRAIDANTAVRFVFLPGSQFDFSWFQFC